MNKGEAKCLCVYIYIYIYIYTHISFKDTKTKALHLWIVTNCLRVNEPQKVILA